MFFLSHLIYSFSVIYGNTQSLFYELFYELILNPKLELISLIAVHYSVIAVFEIFFVEINQVAES